MERSDYVNLVKQTVNEFKLTRKSMRLRKLWNGVGIKFLSQPIDVLPIIAYSFSQLDQLTAFKLMKICINR